MTDARDGGYSDGDSPADGTETVGFTDDELRRLEQMTASDVDGRKTPEVAFGGWEPTGEDAEIFDPSTDKLTKAECRRVRVLGTAPKNVPVIKLAEAAGVAKSTVYYHLNGRCDHDHGDSNESGDTSPLSDFGEQKNSRYGQAGDD